MIGPSRKQQTPVKSPAKNSKHKKSTPKNKSQIKSVNFKPLKKVNLHDHYCDDK